MYVQLMFNEMVNKHVTQTPYFSFLPGICPTQNLHLYLGWA